MIDTRPESRPETVVPPSGREHHLDAVRGLLMLLGVPYHAALPYREDGQTWMVLSSDGSLGLTKAVEFLHLFRMQGFFLIAGYFTGMLLLKRSAREYSRTRLARLLPPLATGILILVPVMNLLAALQNAPETQQAFTQWSQDVTEPGRAATGHLWFVIVLIYYTLAATAIARLPMMRTFRWSMSARTARGVMVPSVLGAGLGIGLYEVAVLKAKLLLPALALNPFCLGFALEYAPYFAVGLVLNRTPALNERFNRLSILIIIIAIGAAAVAVLVDDLPAYTRPVLQGLAGLTLSQCVITSARKLFYRESVRIRRLIDASFVIYLLHLPIVVGLFWAVDALPAGYFVRWLVLVGGTLAFSFAGWRIVSRSEWLLYLLSGVQRRRGHLRGPTAQAA